ncbi:MAG: thioredoxin-disulfide reductase [bacterium]|jgi:thioredoxin reductase (NADPH)
MTDPEILIVGAGPAGMTAGIYASRAGHSTLILEKEITGGQLAKTATVENYPGFAEPVNAYDLIQRMETQARRFGCQFQQAEALKLQTSPGGLKVLTTNGTVSPGALIICSGTQPRPLGLENEKELTGRGISYCAICDGPLYQNREVAVVGGGDSALEEAEYLTRFCSRVHLIHRRDQFRAAKVIEQKVRQNPKIILHLSCVVRKINGTERLNGLEIEELKTGNRQLLEVAGLFIYIGLIPNTAWCREVVLVDANGFIITDEHLQAGPPGIFAAGDCRQKTVRQIATAVGDGAIAATSAHDYLTRLAG